MTQPWFDLFEKNRTFIFKIITPNGYGTGFQIFHNENLCGIATAYHVIDHAHEWQEPIKLLHFGSQETIFLKENERVIYAYPNKDLAFIIFNKGKLPLSLDVPDLVPSDKYLKPGAAMGWCGFPNVQPQELCFFSGHVSCYLEKDESYLVDGVAINGVSGGPAFADFGTIIGVVTAYMPNLSRGQALPGLCVVRSVAQYQETLKHIKTLTEAEEKQPPIPETASEIQATQPPSEQAVPDKLP